MRVSGWCGHSRLTYEVSVTQCPTHLVGSLANRPANRSLAINRTGRLNKLVHVKVLSLSRSSPYGLLALDNLKFA